VASAVLRLILPPLIVAALAAGARGESLPPLPDPVNHFSILVGIVRLQDGPALRSDPLQATRMLAVLRHLQRNSASLLRLDLALAEALSARQRTFLLGRVGRPDPMAFLDDLRRSRALLEQVGGPVAPAPVPRATTRRHDENLDCVLVAYGVPLLQRDPALRVPPAQARRLAALLAKVHLLADEDEHSMRTLYHLLTPAQQRAVRARSATWVGGRSVHDLEEDFERLLNGAARAMERAAGPP